MSKTHTYNPKINSRLNAGRSTPKCTWSTFSARASINHALSWMVSSDQRSNKHNPKKWNETRFKIAVHSTEKLRIELVSEVVYQKKRNFFVLVLQQSPHYLVKSHFILCSEIKDQRSISGEMISPKEFTVRANKDKQKDWKGSIRIGKSNLRWEIKDQIELSQRSKIKVQISNGDAFVRLLQPLAVLLGQVPEPELHYAQEVR